MSDGLITVDEFRDRFDIAADIDEKRLAPHLAAAGRRMREWVGDDAYTDALLDAPVDATRKETLENAEAHIAMAFALVGLNTALRTKGMIKGERSGEGNVITSYFSPNEVAAYQQVYLDTAEAIARPYILNSGVAGAVAVADLERTEGATVPC
jgi:uncharacterized protein YfaP (DUF2135 family)